MTTNAYSISLAPDAQAIVLACAHLNAKGDDSHAKPFTPTEWADLAVRIHRSPLGTPAGLLGADVVDLQAALELPESKATRLRRRLDMGGLLAVEAERLSSLGVWIVTRADDEYPARWRQLLGRHAPPVVFGAGPRQQLNTPGVAVVGSRNVDDDVLRYACVLAQRCVASGLSVISGAAKGVDRAAMKGALDAEGSSIGVIADSLERLIRSADVRGPITRGQLTLITPSHPRTPFSVANAMGRNKLIYSLSRFGVVVDSSLREGGTWAGAQEVIRAGWVPLFARDDPRVSRGNHALIAQGAHPLPLDAHAIPVDLLGWAEQVIGEASLQHIPTERQSALPARGARGPVSPIVGALSVADPAAPAQPPLPGLEPIAPSTAQLRRRRGGQRDSGRA